MKIVRRKLIDINAAMLALDKHTRGVKIAYALAKNLAKLETELRALQKAIKPSKEFSEYDVKRVSAVSALAHKDKESGEPKVFNGQYVVTDQAGLEKALKPLRKEYAKAIAAQEKRQDEYETMLDKEIEFKFHKIPADLLEAEGAIAEDAPGLAAMIAPLLGIVIDEPK